MTDAISTYALLGVSAAAAGAVNAVAGGGTLLTFPALMTALESLVPEPGKSANATSTVALLPGAAAAALGYRGQLAETRAWVVVLIGPSVVGGLAGAMLVSTLPERVFAAAVPWLILAATALLAIQPYLTARPAPPSQAPSGSNPPTEPTSTAGLARAVAFQFLVGLYGGYFGAGIGILMLAALGVAGVADIHRANAIKTVLAAAINALAVAVFLLGGHIHWPFAAVMAVSAMLGGYAGAAVAQRLDKNLVRRGVVVLGLMMTAYYFHKQYVAA